MESHGVNSAGRERLDMATCSRRFHRFHLPCTSTLLTDSMRWRFGTLDTTTFTMRTIVTLSTTRGSGRRTRCRPGIRHARGVVGLQAKSTPTIR